MTEKNAKKVENLRKMIKDTEAKIEKLQLQKALYEHSLQSIVKDAGENQ